MTMAEYVEWAAFYAEEPFGDVRADLRIGVLAVTTAKAMGVKKRLNPLDFMPVVQAQQEADAAAAALSERVRTMRGVFENHLGPLRLRRTVLTKER